MGKEFRWFELDKLRTSDLEAPFSSKFENYDGDMKIMVILDFGENTPKEFISRTKFVYDEATKSYIDQKSGLNVYEKDCTGPEHEVGASEVLAYIKRLNTERLYKKYAQAVGSEIEYYKHLKNLESKAQKM